VKAKQFLWKTHPKSKKFGERLRGCLIISEFRRTKDENQGGKAQGGRKIECGWGQPPQPHRTWIPALPFTAGRRNDRFSPTALE
jgi:hypothetical protein